MLLVPRYCYGNRNQGEKAAKVFPVAGNIQILMQKVIRAKRENRGKDNR